MSALAASKLTLLVRRTRLARLVRLVRLALLALLLPLVGPLPSPLHLRAAAQAPGVPGSGTPAPTGQDPPSGPQEPGARGDRTDADEPDGQAGDDLSDLMLGVDRLLEQSLQAAARELERKNYPAALAALERAHELAPAQLDTTVRLAELLGLVGNVERAATLYRQVLEQDDRRADAHIALADLIVRTGEDADLAEASTLLTRARELSGNEPELILRQARVAARRGRFEQAERAYASYREAAPIDDPMRLELGDFYRDFGKPDAALEHYRLVGSDPAPGGGNSRRSASAAGTARNASVAAGAAAQRIFALEVEREARRYGFAPTRRTPPARVKAMIDRGRTLSAEGAHGEASAILQEAIALSPTHAPARAALGDVLSAAGERDAAELAYLRALAFEPRPEVERALAELYLSDPAGRQAAQAAVLLERVLARRPDWTELHLTLARALRRAGELPGALLHARRFVAQAGPGVDRRRAEALASELAGLLGQMDGQSGSKTGGKTGGETGGDRGSGASGALHREEPAVLAEARAHLSRGQVEAALAVLRERGDDAGSVEVALLRARILHGAGRLDEARAALAALLARDRHNAEAHALLGRVLLQSGRPADHSAGRAALAEAERLGDVDSSLELARIDLAGGDGAFTWLQDGPRLLSLLHARERLRGLAVHDSAATRAEAATLSARVEERLWMLGAAVALLLVLLLLGGLWLRHLLWGGGDLGRLIEDAPEAGPALMTILSAVRHEVLKHNTMMLTGLCEALARGEDPQATADQAEHIRKALLGAGGAADRLDGYVEQLEQLGRAHGVRLNLPRRDAAVGALLDGFAVLDGVERELRRVARLSPRRRRKLLARLSEASELINRQAADRLRALLDSVRTLEVDEQLLREIHARIGSEPALAEHPLAPLELEAAGSLPCRVSLPYQVFEDVLANLMRNALQAMARGAASNAPLPLGLRVHAAPDPITGLSEVAFHVRDRAPEGLSDEQLRRRYIEAGLGLTADLVSRHEGALEVRTDEPGWAKAVVLRVPGERVDVHDALEDGVERPLRGAAR